MIYYLGILALATASWAHPPCVCTRDLKPVCGSDGTTYNNECLLDCARSRGKSDLALQSRGRCDGGQDPNSCICTLELKPVCGSDGVTYPNRCAMDCQARSRNVEITKAHDGDCRQKRGIALPDAPCMCTMDYRPVCASDGHTYPNGCAMRCQQGKNAGIWKIHDGACKPTREAVKVAEPDFCECTEELEPVCGTDDHTYPNACVLRCAQRGKADLELQHKGRCEAKLPVLQDIPKKYGGCDCTRNLEPVCGTDGETYPNECLMKCVGAQLDRQGRCDGFIQTVVVNDE